MASSPIAAAAASSSTASSSRLETIIVAFSDLDHGFHLLAWTINMAARPGDVVIALHLQDRGYGDFSSLLFIYFLFRFPLSISLN